MKRIAWVLALVAAGCGKPAPPPSPTAVAPPAPTSAPEKSKKEKPEKLSREEERRQKVLEQLEILGDDPANEAARRRLQKELGITPEPPPPLVPRPPAAPRPQLTVTVNGTDVPEVAAGWPVVVEVTVHAPASGPMELKAPSGRWSDLVRVEFPDGWSPKAAVEGTGALSMDGPTYGRLVWTMSPEQADARPRGEVVVRATLGEQRVQARVRLIAKKGVTPQAAIERAFAFVRYRTALREAEGALADVDEAVKTWRWGAPHPRLLELRADVLLGLGRKPEAIQALDAAIDSAKKLRLPIGALAARREAVAESK